MAPQAFSGSLRGSTLPRRARCESSLRSHFLSKFATSAPQENSNQTPVGCWFGTIGFARNPAPNAQQRPRAVPRTVPPLGGFSRGSAASADDRVVSRHPGRVYAARRLTTVPKCGSSASSPVGRTLPRGSALQNGCRRHGSETLTTAPSLVACLREGLLRLDEIRRPLGT
jgi:hypothetical protein